METEIFMGAIAAVSAAGGYASRAIGDYVKRRGALEDKFLSRIEALELKIDEKDRVIDSLQAQVHQLESKVQQLEQERENLLKSLPVIPHG